MQNDKYELSRFDRMFFHQSIGLPHGSLTSFCPLWVMTPASRGWGQRSPYLHVKGMGENWISHKSMLSYVKWKPFGPVSYGCWPLPYPVTHPPPTWPFDLDIDLQRSNLTFLRFRLILTNSGSGNPKIITKLDTLDLLTSKLTSKGQIWPFWDFGWFWLIRGRRIWKSSLNLT